MDGLPQGPRFTSDWFSEWVPTWEKHVAPRIAGRPNARWLEVGSYEGRSALWTLDNLMNGEGSELTCVDFWGGPYEAVFDANLAGRTNMRKVKGLFHTTLPTFLADSINTFDGAYLDGSHTEEETRASAGILWQLLKPNGLLVFDDYGHEMYPGVKLATDEFLARLDIRHEILFKGPPLRVPQAPWQVIVMKREG